MKYVNFLFLSFLFAGCVKDIPTLQERKINVLSTALKNSFEEVDIKTSTFSLFSLQKKSLDCKNKTLNVYVESDGLAWLSRTTISKDPTPIDSTILKLIYEDKNECKVYLARPCQFINSNSCNSSYWTNKRFSKEVVQSYDETLNQLKTKYKNKNFNLIGHSGGGAIATILASKRTDINNLITIAGNLDIQKWVQIHKISELEGSLNPSDYTKKLESINQYHFIGTNDKIIPKEVFFSYYSKFNRKDKIKYKLYEQEHNCCWVEPFKELINR